MESTIQSLDTLGHENRVSLNWIKAHNGHAMNDIADNLARESSASFGPHPQIPIPNSYVKSLIDAETERRWNAGWIHTEGHRQMKLFFPLSIKAKQKNCTKLPNPYMAKPLDG